MAENNQTVRGALTAADSTVGPYRFRRASTSYGTIRISLYTPTGGAWAGTITLQSSDPDQNVWVNEDEWIADGAKTYTPGGDCDLRWKFTTYTSGTAIGSFVSNA